MFLLWAYFNNGEEIFADDLNNNEIAVDEYLRVPLFLAQKWLREEKGIHIEVLYQPVTWTCKIYNLKNYEYIKGYTFFVSYEEALSEGIKEAIKHIEII